MTFMGNADILIITALKEEFMALENKLPNVLRVSSSSGDSRIYYQSKLKTQEGEYNIAIMPILGMGRVKATSATKDALMRWDPEYVILVGIAGGFEQSDVNLGDLLISTQIVDYEVQKVEAGKSNYRFEVHRADNRLLNEATILQNSDWLSLITEPRPKAGKTVVKIGPIATGDKVVAKTEFVDTLLSRWSDLKGVEMEAGGVATACFDSTKKPGFFMVRGVSDLANESKNDPDVITWRKYACDIAASFTVALIKTGQTPIKRLMGQTSLIDLANTAIRPRLALHELSHLLQRCDEFESMKHLQALFSGELSIWKYGLPSAHSIRERVDLVIDYLYDKQTVSGENGLFLFLENLRNRYYPSDSRYEGLSKALIILKVSKFS